MNDRIIVTLINPSDRRFYQAQWDDPVTGRTKTRSTKTTVKRDAERFAARLEDELNAGTYKPAVNITWDELQTRYEREVGATKAIKTRLKTQSMFNKIKEYFDPKMAAAVANANLISEYSAKLREDKRRPDTVRGHLAELRKVLRWGVKLGLIRTMPHIQFPDNIAGMKGRPPTLEEFDRILLAVPKCEMVGTWADEWTHFIRGLWLSSLRLEESMKLHWSDDRELCVDFTHRRPMFRIQAASEKGRQFRLLAMTPDFAQFLQETPEKDRRGYVFNPFTNPQGRRKGKHRPTANHAGRVISAIGKLAKVRVNDKKFASAHDFRRAFGFRWAKLVMPKILQELMRHASIETTMKYYVGSMAEDAGDAVWKAAPPPMPTATQPTGNSSGNSQPETPQDTKTENQQTA